METLWCLAFITASFTSNGLAVECRHTLARPSTDLQGAVRTVVEKDLADNVEPSGPKGVAFHIRTTNFSPEGQVLSVEDCVSKCNRTDFIWQLGRLMEEHEHFSDGRPERVTKFVWDAEGHVLEEDVGYNGVVECVKRYDRTDSSLTISESCEGDVLAQRRVYTHDEVNGTTQILDFGSGNEDGSEVSSCEERSVRRDDGVVVIHALCESGYEHHVSLDSHWRVIEDERNDEDGFYNRKTNQFNKLGREVEVAEWNKDGSNINRRQYVYEDDASGNWIRRTELFGSSAMKSQVEGEITVRTIEYY